MSTKLIMICLSKVYLVPTCKFPVGLAGVIWVWGILANLYGIQCQNRNSTLSCSVFCYITFHSYITCLSPILTPWIFDDPIVNSIFCSVPNSCYNWWLRTCSCLWWISLEKGSSKSTRERCHWSIWQRVSIIWICKFLNQFYLKSKGLKEPALWV